MNSLALLRPLLVSLACLAPALALSQWQWVDNDGRKVFSDRPPPSDVPAARILRQPGQRPVSAAAAAATAAAPEATPAASAASAARPAGSAPRIAGKDKALEDKKKQAEAAEAAKKKAEEEKIAAIKVENCERSKRSKAALDSGARISRTNEKGEREFLDDRQREAESQRLGSLIARDCGAQ